MEAAAQSGLRPDLPAAATAGLERGEQTPEPGREIGSAPSSSSSAGSPAVPARSGAKASSVRRVGGFSLDRGLLELAEKFARSGRRVSCTEAKRLWEHAQEKGITDLARRTLRWTLEAFPYTERAASLMETLLSDGRVRSCYKQIHGVKYDRDLLELAERFAEDGHVSLQEAEQLWERAHDGGRVTATEARTLRYTLDLHRYTAKAAAYLQSMLAAPQEGNRQKPKQVVVRWTWRKLPGFSFPAFPVVHPKKEHRYSLVLCHPMGWSGVFFLGSGALVEDLLVKSRLIRDHCKILCPGAKKYGDWKLWFKYHGKDTGGTPLCHAQRIDDKDMDQTLKFVSAVIDREIQVLGSPARVGLSGYSQGGCVSLALGLSLPYSLGIVVSQRGMLMKRTMDLHEHRDSRTQPSQNMFLTAGGLDDVFLEPNQLAAKQWLERKGFKVAYRVFKKLDHGEHDKAEMAAIRQATVTAFHAAEFGPRATPLPSAPPAKATSAAGSSAPPRLKRTRSFAELGGRVKKARRLRRLAAAKPAQPAPVAVEAPPTSSPPAPQP